ncbi:hypothetical protein JW964_14110, partial [candidate division KSB1 bacterium]|nr:hypothetical protein [candidate division KSB1 bacterium]
MDRREFLKYSGFLTSASIFSMIGMPSIHGMTKTQIPDMRLYWQTWKTGRPYTPDIDTDGKLWHGHESLFCSDPDKNVTDKIDSSYLKGQPLSTVLCQGDNVYILVQKSPSIYVYRKDKKVFDRFPLPEPESNIWFGVRVPGDHRLYLYARNLGKLIIWDSEIDKGIAINYPAKLDLWSGFYVKNDEAIYSFTLDAKPCRLIRFDLKKQVYDAIIPAPDANLEITGVNPVGEMLYCSDRFTGRIFPFNYVHRTWGDPVTAPGIGTEYGFVGMGCSYRGLALYCLSTYQGKMKYDFNTNKYLSQKEEDIGIDGLPHHFLNKYLVYDPAENKFGYLEARARGRYPLLCYSLVHNDKLIITG